MITFNDVKRTTETTFFFFPDGWHDMLAHFLETASVPDSEYRILSYTETRQTYPDLQVPMIPDHPSLAGNPKAYHEPLTMISHMDIHDLERKLWEIDGSDEAIEWEESCVEKLLAEEQARNECLNGWLPGLKRESEDVR